MMKNLTLPGLGAVVLSASLVVIAEADEFGWTIDSVIEQIDQQALGFSAAVTDMEISWQRPGEEQPYRTATGRLYVNREGVLRFEERVPDMRTLLVTASELHDYDPERGVVDRFTLAEHRERLAPYARLGFTTTGAGLRDGYLVTLLGEDYVSGRRIVGLELTPKKETARESVARLQLWLDQSSWLPVSQAIVNVSSGETLTITYNGMVRNPRLDPALFKAEWPRRTKTITH